jgi:hypothetical protein
MKYIILLLIFLPSIAIADPYTIEIKIRAFSLKDQYGNQHEIDETTRLILLSKDMKGGKIIRNGLKETYRNYLKNHNTVFIADVSGMPRLIRKFIALPKMRRYPYSILLDLGPSVTKDLPSQPDKATLICVRDLRITDIQYIENPDLIRPAIENTDIGNGLKIPGAIVAPKN